LEEAALMVRTKLTDKDIPSFPSFDRSARALAKMAWYQLAHGT
jgi:hypothetical protein